MAHAGTPTDLAKQPATSTTNGLWQALLAAIVILALGAGMVFVASNVASSRSVAPAADNSYTQIEAQRGGATLGAADSSYTQVEGIRGGAFSAANPLEGTRGGAFTAASQAALLAQGAASNEGAGRIVGHRGAMIGQ